MSAAATTVPFDSRVADGRAMALAELPVVAFHELSLVPTVCRHVVRLPFAFRETTATPVGVVRTVVLSVAIDPDWKTNGAPNVGVVAPSVDDQTPSSW